MCDVPSVSLFNPADQIEDEEDAWGAPELKVGLGERVPCQVVLVTTSPRGIEVILVSITTLASVPVPSLANEGWSSDDRAANARWLLVDLHVAIFVRIVLILAAVVIWNWIPDRRSYRIDKAYESKDVKLWWALLRVNYRCCMNWTVFKFRVTDNFRQVLHHF